MYNIQKILLKFVVFGLVFPITLQDMFDNASPMFDYQKYIILDSNEIYTGGVGIFEDNVYIEGNGATIDLEYGLGIWVYSDGEILSNLDISKATLINGAEYGISYAGYSTGNILNTNIINSTYGVKIFDNSIVNIKNTNIIDNAFYGVALYCNTPMLTLSYCNAWNNLEDYMENCPG